MGRKWYKSRHEWDGKGISPGTSGTEKEKEIVVEHGSQIGVLCYIMPMPGKRLH